MVSLLSPANPFASGRVFDFGQVQGAVPASPHPSLVGHVSIVHAPVGAQLPHPHFTTHAVRAVAAPLAAAPATVYSPVVSHRAVYTPSAMPVTLHGPVGSPMSSPMAGYRTVLPHNGMPRVLDGVGTPEGFASRRSLSEERVRVDVLERLPPAKELAKGQKAERPVPPAISPPQSAAISIPDSSASRSATGSCSGTPTRSVSKEPRIREEGARSSEGSKAERPVPPAISPQSTRASLSMRSSSRRTPTAESSSKSAMRFPSKGRQPGCQKSLQAAEPWDNRNAPGNDFSSSLRDRVLPMTSGRSRSLSRSMSLSRSASQELGDSSEEAQAGARLSRAHTASFRLKCSDRPDRSPSAERRASSRASRSSRSASASPSRAVRSLNWFPHFQAPLHGHGSERESQRSFESQLRGSRAPLPMQLKTML